MDDDATEALKAYYAPPGETVADPEAFGQAVRALIPTIYALTASGDNVIPFPLHRRR